MDLSLESILAAVRSAKRHIHWKPGKAERHLAKRILLGQLSPDSTVKTYEAIIRRILTDPLSELYTFRYNESDFPTVTAELAGKLWLVMLDMSGRMETAFQVVQPDTYFSDSRFTYWGRLQEFAL